MFSFVDISGDLCSKDSERYVVAAAATVQREKISSITNRIHRLKKEFLKNEIYEIKSTEFINRSTLEHPFLNKYQFIDRFVCDILPEFRFAAVIMKNAPMEKYFERDRLPYHYVLLMERVNACAARNNRRALMIIDNQARTIDRWTAYAFNNFLFRSGKGVGLGNIIEMPLFADSEMTQGIQVADIAASILRHYHDRALYAKEPSSRFEEKVGEYCAIITKHSPTYNTRARPLYVAPENFVEKNFTKH